MQLIAYVLLVAFVYPMSLLPLRVLYVLADVGYVLLRYILRYRVRVVRDNLSKSFPGMTEAELRRLTNRYFRYLAELTMEGVKALSMSRRQLLKRLKLEVPVKLDEMFDRGQHVIVATSHYGNWEWSGLALSLQSKFQPVGLYLPHGNRWISRGMVSRRSRFGMMLVAPDDVRRFFARYSGRPTMTVFIADQSPGNPNKAYWVDFMNRKTPFLVGPGKLSSSLGRPLWFGKVVRVKRGHYRGEFDMLVEDTRSMTPEQITQLYATWLEGVIRERPEYWLWSHRRWKHVPERS